MKKPNPACVHVGGRNDAARAYSCLVGRGVTAELAEVNMVDVI